MHGDSYPHPYAKTQNMAVNPIPDGYHSVTPFLTVKGAAKLMEFVKQAFDAKEIHCMNRRDGTIGHAAVRIGDSIVEMAEASVDLKPMPGAIHLYVSDTDVTYERALQSGATSLHTPMDMFYGERGAAVKDPVGNYWYIATHTEDVSRHELEKRSDVFMKPKRRS